MGNAAGRGPGLLIGRVLGVPVYVSWSWPIVALVITFVFREPAGQVASGAGAVAVAFSYAVLLYASVLVHEISHAAVARAFGLPVRSIVLHVLGGVTQIDRESRSPGRSFLVAAAGPAMSLLLGLAGLAVLALTDLPPVPDLLVQALTVANLIVGVFNLLPGLPLDGGYLVRAVVWKITGRDRDGTIAAAHVGRVLAIGLLVAGTWLATRGAPGTNWIMVAWAAFLASFIWIGATQAIRVERVRDRIPLLHARRIGRRAVAVPGETPLARALEIAREAQAGAVVIVGHDGTPTGLVSEAAVHAVPEARSPWTSAADVARTLGADSTIDADLSGEDLIVAVRRAAAGELLLLETTGEIYGVLAAADVDRLLSRA
ncbi:site-2 protease family protein [Actinocorallia longicatena]|uniref:Zinc metalloprotease n=1 Tax=Actinocorallia longicatena TaxID=111803 RepID=A0ABP6Q5F1_9ACTN